MTPGISRAPLTSTIGRRAIAVGGKRSVPTDGSANVSLAALKGKNVVVYFYPRDDTPGCTRESCDFRDQAAELGGVVLACLPHTRHAL